MNEEFFYLNKIKKIENKLLNVSNEIFIFFLTKKLETFYILLNIHYLAINNFLIPKENEEYKLLKNKHLEEIGVYLSFNDNIFIVKNIISSFNYKFSKSYLDHFVIIENKINKECFSITFIMFHEFFEKIN